VKNRIAPGIFECLEGSLTIRQVGMQVFLEIEGDNYTCSMTLSEESAQGIEDWLACLRLGK